MFRTILVLVLTAAHFVVPVYGQEINNEEILLTTSVLTGMEVVPITPVKEDADGLEYTVTFRVLNRYLGGNGGVFHPDPVAQYDLFVDFRGPCYADLWISTGLDDDDFSSNVGDEIDYNVGCTGSYRGFSLDAGVLYVDAHRLGQGPNGDVVDFYVAMSRSWGEWNLTLKPEFYLPGGSSLEGGWLVHLKANREWGLSDRLSLSITPEIVVDDGAFGFAPGWFGLVELGLNTRVTDRVLLRPMVKLSTPITNVNDGRDSEWAAGLSTSFNF